MRRVLTVLAGLAQPLSVAAQDDAAALRAASLAATCAACHGTDGRPPPASTLPALAGMPAATLVARLREFQRGTRSGGVMPQLARGYDEAQLAALGAYFAAQRP